MRLYTFLLGNFLLYGLTANANEPVISRIQYKEEWKSVAMEQMMIYKIPASITLAQAIIESSAGNSMLAKKANNHFGIKCHGWTGKTIYLDDDQKGECFRSYENAKASFDDHSLFLRNRERYKFLFQYEVTDYTSWAKGLKQAGYATNPKYDVLLINVIEELQLYELDKIAIENLQSTTVHKSNHAIFDVSHKTKYIVVRKGDTYYKIAKEFKLGLWQLYKYNDLNPKIDLLKEGERIYVQPKRTRSKNESITLKEACTLRQVSQNEGIKLKSILKVNPSMNPDLVLPVGEKVTLR